MALFKVEISGVNTTQLPLLTNEEKTELFKEIKKGNKEARERYIQGNLRLVLSIIQRFSGSNENPDDLFQQPIELDFRCHRHTRELCSILILPSYISLQIVILFIFSIPFWIKSVFPI